MDNLIEFSGGEGAGGGVVHVTTSRDEGLAVREEGGGVGGASHRHRSGRGPGARSRIIEFSGRGHQNITSRDEDLAVREEGGGVATTANSHQP